MVEEGISGLLVSPGDSSSLARAVERVLLDAALRQRLIEGGKQKVQFFSAQKMARSTRAIYQRILAKA
jgi:glycosyltransferase involved in cell wall biosynthesis